MNAVQGTVTVHGGTGTEVDVNDQATTSSQSISLRTELDILGNAGSTVVNRSGSANIFLDSVAGIALNGGSGGNVFTVTSTPPGVPVTINAGNGGDTINVGDNYVFGLPFNILTGIYLMTVHGGTGTTLNLDDQNDNNFTGLLGPTTVSPSFLVNNQSVVFSDVVTGPLGTKNDTATVNYNNVANLIIHGGSALNVFEVESTPAGSAVTIDAGDPIANDPTNPGNDTITIGNDREGLSAILGPVDVNGQGGIDTLAVDDQSATASQRYALGFDSASGHYTLMATGAAPILYNGTVESFIVNGGGGPANVFAVSTVPVGTAVTLNGGAGNDTFDIGDPALGLDVVPGRLVVHGSGGSNALTVNDQATQDAATWTRSSTSIIRDRVDGTTSYRRSRISNATWPPILL